MGTAEKNLPAGKAGIAELIKAKVRGKDPLADVILFGSHARGQAKKDSDWDILILLNRPNVTRMTEKEFNDDLYDIELEKGEIINAFVFSKEEWENKHSVTPLYKNIAKEGIHL